MLPTTRLRMSAPILKKHFSTSITNSVRLYHGGPIRSIADAQPNAAVRFSDLSLDLLTYVKTAGTDTPEAFYTDKDAGVRYQVSELGIVESVAYIPKRDDYSLRCRNFPQIPDLGHREFKPFDRYSSISFNDEQARLDNFSIGLRDQPQMKGYILVYASKETPANKARIRAQRAKDHLVKRRGIEARKIDIIEGGYREQFEIELYILPHGVDPPTPYPTVVPSTVRVIRAGKATMGRTSRSRK